MRRSTKRAQNNTGSGSCKDPFPIMIGWHEIGAFGIPISVRSQYLMQVPYQDERMDPSPLILSPAPSILITLNLSCTVMMLWKNLSPSFSKRKAWIIYNNIHAFFRYDIMVSKHGDSRLIKSLTYVIMTPLPQELRDVCTDRMVINLLNNYNYDLKRYYSLKRCSEEVEWVSMKKHMTP